MSLRRWQGGRLDVRVLHDVVMLAANPMNGAARRDRMHQQVLLLGFVVHCVPSRLYHTPNYHWILVEKNCVRTCVSAGLAKPRHVQPPPRSRFRQSRKPRTHKRVQQAVQVSL